MDFTERENEAKRLIDKMVADSELTTDDKLEMLQDWQMKAFNRLLDPRPKPAREVKCLNVIIEYTKEKVSFV
jgi:hypothetical protein